MDFFEHQEQARKKSHVLVFYFVLAVIGIVIAIYALTMVILFFIGDEARTQPVYDLWKPDIFTYTAIGTLVTVFLASSFKTMQLSGGGSVVARELGGRELDVNTTDFHERRLLNIVEEMAIAAGVPVPAVYVMEGEDSINAFAAGKTTSDAVIGVTRGCMTLLSRDELQGVIAHEFSHILNGDMRLNIRLMGMLFGILFLALMGEMIVRSAFRGSYYSNRRDSGGGVFVVVIAGIGLLVIGYVGSFFANLIKASVSRQREFLADASAVQFTRNPDGIAGALRKIGALSAGSRMQHPMAKDASHLFFGSAFSHQLFATHPPLSVRIKRILPHWDGDFGRAPHAISRSEEPAPERKKNKTALPGMFLDSEDREQRMTEHEAVESMKHVHPEQIELGRDIHTNLPSHWVEACRSRSKAQALVFALLLAQDESLRLRELKRLAEATGPETRELVGKYYTELHSIHSAVKLGLVDLAIPTLRHLTPGEYSLFRTSMWELIESDRQVDLFEFALSRIIARHLDQYFSQRAPVRIRFRSFHRLADETGILLSTLAAMSHRGDEDAVHEAFRKASANLGESAGIEVPHKSAHECGLDRIEAALEKFAAATPIVKKQLLEACSKSILSDGAITSREAELVRAIADTIGCPIPPFVRVAELG